MWPLYLYAAGGFLTAVGIISIKNALEVGLFWPAIVSWLSVNLASERLFST